MILILTTDGDLSSDLVIDWLKYYDANFIRLNSFDLLHKSINISNDNENTSIKLNNQIIQINHIHAVWFRKFGFFPNSDFYSNASKVFDYNIMKHLAKEFKVLLDYISFLLKDKKWITHYSAIGRNKLDVLHLAKECGLCIPKTFICNSKRELKNYNQYIVKSMYDPTIVKHMGENCMMYTNTIQDADYTNLPDIFLPSLIQERIEKSYEIRSFYLMGKFYSMAIFSQNDTQTQLDFRRYNWNKPNRFVPYQLPTNIEEKLDRLMNKIGLNCGSIDIIKSTDDQYFFLEVNPTGQFGMVDFPCNYGLHKLIAETLIKLDK